MNYVYLRIPGEMLWTVGFFDPQNQWHPDTDHPSPEAAAERIHFLNGGAPKGAATKDFAEILKQIRAFMPPGATAPQQFEPHQLKAIEHLRALAQRIVEDRHHKKSEYLEDALRALELYDGMDL